MELEKAKKLARLKVEIGVPVFAKMRPWTFTTSKRWLGPAAN
jgi:hypothetical protein